ncbi:MAG: ABC transporter ATP-binding protein [Actinomycetota bacterium]|nr:ABC transporter ATP-binding protein [Actinomycetota bacterium]
METPLLSARAVGRSYGARVAVRPTDFDLRQGEAVALVGPNGAGKSTLLALLAGAIEPSAGSVDRRDGVRVGWAPQRSAHYGRLSARENLELFARLEDEADPEAAAGRLADEFELPEGVSSANLSTGNRQRLNLALALLGEPRVLLLDEPTSALDPEHRGRLWARLESLPEAGGALVFVTQSTEEVERLAERVVALREGSVVFDGPVADYELAEPEAVRP